MKAVMFTIQEDLHTKVKVLATEEHMTLKGFIISLLEKAVEKKGEKK